jgi:hypothetical protein
MLWHAWWEEDTKTRSVYDVGLIKISMGTKSGDPFGQVISGILTLKVPE